MFKPHNTPLYLKALAGFMSGITAAGVTDTSPEDYTLYGQMADAWAQQFDTAWGVSVPTGLELELIGDASASMWIGRSPPPSDGAILPGTYDQTVQAAIARVKQGNAQAVGEGVDPDDTGGGGGGGSGVLFAFPNRIDVSVNKAHVDNPQSTVPVLVTKTGTNNAGGFNGGGLGNKAMLGIQGFNGMPLSELQSVVWIWQELEAAHPDPLGLRVYANLIIEPDPIGFPGVYKVLVLSDTLAPIIDVISTPLGGGSWKITWPTDSKKLVFCVNPAGLPAPPNPVESVWVSPPPGVPFFSAVNNMYFTQLFAMADILAAYPNARLVDASSGDGGLPHTTVTPALMIIVGDSNNVVMVSRLIKQVQVNGETV